MRINDDELFHFLRNRAKYYAAIMICMLYTPPHVFYVFHFFLNEFFFSLSNLFHNLSFIMQIVILEREKMLISMTKNSLGCNSISEIYE